MVTLHRVARLASSMDDRAADLRQLGHLLGLAALEQFLDTGKTLGDVAAGHAAGVEGTHGQLGAGLADGLGGDDAHGLTHAHGLADGQVDAVAVGAHAAAGLAGEHGAHLDGHLAVGVALGLGLLAELLFNELGIVAGHQLFMADQHLAGLEVHEVLGEVAALEALRRTSR